MAADLTFGTVPPLYKEIYDIVCPEELELDRDIFLAIFSKSGLQKQILRQIWDIVDTRCGNLTRTGVYRALALVGLAQQGHTPSAKLLENYTNQELPTPALGDLQELSVLNGKLRREKSPNILPYSYDDLCELDLIKLELMPEKKGLILKHVEYELHSQRYHSTVLRRYNDFLSLHELLLLRFPYRMVPRLPPKKLMGVSREFIEERRKSLRRYINLVARHPVMYEDRVIQFFLTHHGSDTQHKIKENFRGDPDEFMTNKNALRAKELVPKDTQLQLGTAKDHIKLLYQCVGRLQEVAQRMMNRSIEEAQDMLIFGKELSIVAHDSTYISNWIAGKSTAWTHLKRGFKQVCVEFAGLSDTNSTKARREDEGIVEKLSLLLDLIVAYRDLCERHEKGVLHDHQRALHKMGQYKKKKQAATVQGPAESGTVEQLEQRILDQESYISNMENRNYFSLHCLQLETQLVHANLDILFGVLQTMSTSQSTSYRELGDVWTKMVPVVNAIVPGFYNPPFSRSRPTSPNGSPLVTSKHAPPT